MEPSPAAVGSEAKGKKRKTPPTPVEMPSKVPKSAKEDGKKTKGEKSVKAKTGKKEESVSTGESRIKSSLDEKEASKRAEKKAKKKEKKRKMEQGGK